MAYCTVEQVSAELKGVEFTNATMVKRTSVDEFIAEADAEIDAKLTRRYAVPITGTAALFVIRRISRAMVVRRLAPMLAVNTGDEKAKGEASSGPQFDPDKALDDIASGKTLLVDAQASGRAPVTNSYASENAIEPTFKRDEESW